MVFKGMLVSRLFLDLLVSPACASTSSTLVVGVAPSTMTTFISSDIQLEGVSVVDGDRIGFHAGDTCPATPMDLNPSPFTVSGGTKTLQNVIMESVGTFSLCAQANGQADLVKQAGLTITVQAAVTAIEPNYGLTPGMETEFTITSLATDDVEQNDRISFVKEGNPCPVDASDLTPLDASLKVTITLPDVVGIYDVCFKKTSIHTISKQSPTQVVVGTTTPTTSQPGSEVFEETWITTTPPSANWAENLNLLVPVAILVGVQSSCLWEA